MFAGDPRCCRGAEEQHHRGDVVRRAQTSERDGALQLVEPVLDAEDLSERLGGHRSWRHGVDPDVALRQFQRQGLREVDEACLGRRVRPVYGEPRVPAPEVMFTIAPPAGMCRAAALQPWNADVRLSSVCARNVSSSVSTSSWTFLSSEPPTLLTHTSMPPSSDTVRSASVSEKSRMSAGATSTRQPRSRMPLAVISRSCSAAR